MKIVLRLDGIAPSGVSDRALERRWFVSLATTADPRQCEQTTPCNLGGGAYPLQGSERFLFCSWRGRHAAIISLASRTRTGRFAMDLSAYLLTGVIEATTPPGESLADAQSRA